MSNGNYAGIRPDNTYDQHGQKPSLRVDEAILTTITPVLNADRIESWVVSRHLLRSTSDFFLQALNKGGGTRRDPIYVHVADTRTFEHLAGWIDSKTLDDQMSMLEMQNLCFVAEKIWTHELADRIIDKIRETTKIHPFYIYQNGHTIQKIYEKTVPTSHLQQLNSRLRQLCVEQAVGKFVMDSMEAGDSEGEEVMIGRETLPKVYDVCKDNVELFTDFFKELQHHVMHETERGPWEFHSDVDYRTCWYHYHGEGRVCYRRGPFYGA